MVWHVYVTISGEGRIARLEMDPATAVLEMIEDVKAPGRPAPIAVSPDETVLHVGRRDDLRLESFRRDRQTGALASIGEIPVENDPCYMGMDGSGRYLLSAYYIGERAAVHGTDGEGALLHPPIEWRHTGRGSHYFETDRSNRFAFVPHIHGNGAANAIFQFRFDSESGCLASNDPDRVAPAGDDGPRHFCWHPARDLLYASNEQGCSVTTYAFDTTAGTLRPLATAPTSPEDWEGPNTCAQIRLTPDGRFLYAANRGHDSLACFAIDASSGEPSAIGHAEAEPTPRVMAITPDGRHLLSAGLDSGSIQVFAIDQGSGALDLLAVHEVGAQPMWISVLAAA